MIEVAIPKDVTQYKATLIGPLTARQTVCVAITAAVEFGMYHLIKMIAPDVSLNTLIGIMAVIAIPIMAFAIVKPFDLPLEKYLKNVFLLNVIAPVKRPYKTVNLLSEPDAPKPQIKQKVYSARELKLHPDYVMYE